MSTRLNMDYLRMESEGLFLSFLPSILARETPAVRGAPDPINRCQVERRCLRPPLIAAVGLLVTGLGW